MARFREYLKRWLRWERGRQGTGYDKLLLAVNPLLIPFDMYLLRYPVGSHIPPHRDPVPGRCHYRLNIVVRRSQQGGEFVCADPIYSSRRIHLFRSDLSTHSVTRVDGTPRYVLSLGWVLRGDASR
jgi:hypothetical protein